MTPELIDALIARHPTVDVERMINILEEEVKIFNSQFPEGSEPNDLRFPLGSDLNVNLIATVIGKYVKSLNSK